MAIAKLDKNPTTAIIIPIKNNMNSNEFCNECPYCSKENHGTVGTQNFKCAYSSDKRVIRLKVYEKERVESPFWCPKKKSMLSEEQQKRWEASRQKIKAEEKWRQLEGIRAWGDIKAGTTYHCPPSPFHGRMNIKIEFIYPGSLRAIDIDTNKNVWLYKNDESYKFMSVIKDG